ncbi:MAG TPA: ABC transporter permease subunit [Actinoplanes sp.]|nr:ABC transporter permease subunit [Actinoplanes sp.]
MSLYKAESRRLVKRRFTKWLVIGCLVVLAAVAVGVFLTNQKVGPAQVATAQAKADQDFQEVTRQATQEQQRCQTAQGTPDAANYPPDCAQMYTPTREDFSYQNYMPSTFEFRTAFKVMVTTLAAIFALMAFVIGASFVGAEWSSGGMMNLLLWRPQRLKVLGTKLAALLVGLAALTTVVLVAWTGFFWLVGRLRGNTNGMTSGAWQSLVLTEVRALVLVLAAGALGFGLASLGRHTALALGAAIGAVVLFQFGLVTVLSLAQVKFAEAFLVPFWVAAWMNKSVTLENYNSCNFSATQGCQPETLTITWPAAGGVFAAVIVLVVGAAMWTMRSRDIT